MSKRKGLSAASYWHKRYLRLLNDNKNLRDVAIWYMKRKDYVGFYNYFVQFVNKKDKYFPKEYFINKE